jgi:hypothetical protein
VIAPRLNNIWTRVGSLVAAAATLAVVWLVLLPRWSNRPESVAQHEFLTGRGVDPSAMFYSDLEIAYRVNARLEGRGNTLNDE